MLALTPARYLPWVINFVHFQLFIMFGLTPAQIYPLSDLETRLALEISHESVEVKAIV